MALSKGDCTRQWRGLIGGIIDKWSNESLYVFKFFFSISNPYFCLFDSSIFFFRNYENIKIFKLGVIIGSIMVSSISK